MKWQEIGRLRCSVARALSAPSDRFECRLSEKGLDLYPVLISLVRWGERWMADEGDVRGRAAARRLPGAPLLAALGLAGCAAPGPALESLPAGRLDDCGAAEAATRPGLDVAVAIDTSGSTARPSGADIDGDGVVGEFWNGQPTDRGDSLLAAQVAGVKALVSEAPARDLRLAIVSFSGSYRFDEPAPLRDAVVQADLTDETPRLEVALRRVLRRGSRGTASFSAAMGRSLEALGSPGERGDERRAVVLLLSDSPTPVRPGPTQYYYRALEGIPRGAFVRSDPRMAVAAKRARRSRVVIHTFGLGEAAATDTPHLLSHIAWATGGDYWPVSDPARLHCSLSRALFR